jgi:hypothetical protein
MDQGWGRVGTWFVARLCSIRELQHCIERLECLMQSVYGYGKRCILLERDQISQTAFLRSLPSWRESREAGTRFCIHPPTSGNLCTSNYE